MTFKEKEKTMYDMITEAITKLKDIAAKINNNDLKRKIRQQIIDLSVIRDETKYSGEGN